MHHKIHVGVAPSQLNLQVLLLTQEMHDLVCFSFVVYRGQEWRGGFDSVVQVGLELLIINPYSASTVRAKVYSTPSPLGFQTPLMMLSAN